MERTMLIGVPKEIMDNEFRVGLVPSSVRELTMRGHQVLVETQAGAGAGMADAAYQAAGATLVGSAEEIFGRAELIVKVKEPLAAERKPLPKRAGAVHLSPPRAGSATRPTTCWPSGCTAIAYETVTVADGAPAAADADVGGRRPDGAAGRRALPRKGSTAAAASCSAACPACRRPTSSCSAAARSAPMRR